MVGKGEDGGRLQDLNLSKYALQISFASLELVMNRKPNQMLFRLLYISFLPISSHLELLW